MPGNAATNACATGAVNASPEVNVNRNDDSSPTRSPRTSRNTDNIDGTKSTINVVIQKVTDPAHPWGEFDGVAWITGQRNTAEALELIGAIDYMCVPNINRSGFGHFCAVALD